MPELVDDRGVDLLGVLEVGRRVRADDRCDLGQGRQRPDEDPVEHRPRDEEWGNVHEARIVVAGVAVPGGQIDEPVVRLVRWAILRVAMGEVASLVRRDAAGRDDETVERAVPGRRVVEPGLPRMDHDREPGPGGSSGIEHVAVLGHQARVQPAQERHRRVRIVRVTVHLEGRMGVDGRLRDPGRLHVARGVWRSSRRLPEGGTREVGVLRDRRVEDDVGHHPIRPLRAEERLELLLGARLVVPRAAERDERRIPAPLVGIEGAGRQAGGPDPGRVEHSPSPCDEVIQGRRCPGLGTHRRIRGAVHGTMIRGPRDRAPGRAASHHRTRSARP